MPNLSTYHEARRMLIELRQAAQADEDRSLRPAVDVNDSGIVGLIAGLSQDEFAAVAAESRPAGLSPL